MGADFVKAGFHLLARFRRETFDRNGVTRFGVTEKAVLREGDAANTRNRADPFEQIFVELRDGRANLVAVLQRRHRKQQKMIAVITEFDVRYLLETANEKCRDDQEQ